MTTPINTIEITRIDVTKPLSTHNLVAYINGNRIDDIISFSIVGIEDEGLAIEIEYMKRDVDGNYLTKENLYEVLKFYWNYNDNTDRVIGDTYEEGDETR